MIYNKLRAKLEMNRDPLQDCLWQEIQMHSKLIMIEKNEILIDFGSKHRYTYFIVSGSFLASVISEAGVKRAIWFHFDELFSTISAVDSYFMNKPSPYAYKAMEDSMVIQFHKQKIDDWIAQYPTFSQIYFNGIIRDYSALYEISAFRISNSPIQFLEFIKTKYPTILERVSSKNMAHFLGVSPEWYSKLKRKRKALN
ncbi:MAG: Crp/Fnr family transcriptional regulator [Bacteroidota bacterium]